MTDKTKTIDATQTFANDLFGWDTIFAISFTKANETIANNASSPKQFEMPWPSQGADKRTLQGNWGPWRLEIGGSGGTILMRCPVTTGKLWFQNMWTPRTEVDIGGIELNVECSLTNLDVQAANDRGLDAKDIVPTHATGGTTGNFALNTESISASRPACTVNWTSWYITGTQKVDGKDRFRPDLEDGIVINLALDDYPKVESTATNSMGQTQWNNGKGSAPMLIAMVTAAFTNYFNQYGLAEFKHIFSAFVVGANCKDPKWQWLQPHTVSYAVSIGTLATPGSCYLGVLALTQPGKVQTASMSQQIDGRMGAVFPKADSVFAISHELFVKKWLLPGVFLAVPNSKSSDWTIKGSTISNNRDMMIGNIYANKDHTLTTELHVKKGSWNLTLKESLIELDVSSMEFEWLAKRKVIGTYWDCFELELKSGTDSEGTPYKNVLHAKQAQGTSPTVTSFEIRGTLSHDQAWVPDGAHGRS
ncbi:MAG: P-47 protein [Candidatus Kentron sp. G]|nr:MAG: P-47 protein [Candidatus Kentron sp. G]VFN03366.1 MAG: P-47 protein [Candidatus Kentron sp. G]VFN04819.1 MAG: P-47 protein [Candidatus Kentron sp. G]